LDLIIRSLRIPVEKDGTKEYVKAASQRLKVDETSVEIVKILSKSLDAGSPDQFYYEISVVVRVARGFDNKEDLPVYAGGQEADGDGNQAAARRGVAEGSELHASTSGLTSGQGRLGWSKQGRERPIIVGFGPAGMFAALELIDHGIKPLVFERGKRIEERSMDVERFINERELDPESNIQFGEGGAGSYSDGKLFSRAKNSGYANRVLKTFIRFGAPERIGYMRKPHVGTDVLCKIVRNMRSYILEQGGEIHYGSRMTDVLISGGKVRGIVINGEKEYYSPVVYLAVGHSARDTFEMIRKKGITLEQKAISVGVRVEHPVETINLIRYGAKYKDFPGIGAANYSFTYTDRKTGRGVYTFCMCPGGEVINASSEEGMMVVNGMSYSLRSSAFSNAAIVVTCRTDDYESTDPLAGIEFQKQIERKAFEAVGGKWEVPAQNLVDFLGGRISDSLNINSYKMGAVAADMYDIIPGFVSEALLTAFGKWKADCPLFVSSHAILLGAETRTSSPVRITRNATYESVSAKNLYPIGEGAGYAGGITSSAADAMRAVEGSLSALGATGVVH
jgi:uncharacterized protein